MSIFSGIGDMIGGNLGRQMIGGLARQGSDASNPLTQPQRQPFQSALMDMLFSPNGASNFLKNDPFIQAQTKSIGDWAKANFAQSGNMPLTSITGSSQLAGVQGQEFNQRIQDYLMGGGYTMNNNYGGQPYTAAMGPMSGFFNQQQGGAGQLFNGISSFFGGMGGGGGGGFTSTLMGGPDGGGGL